MYVQGDTTNIRDWLMMNKTFYKDSWNMTNGYSFFFKLSLHSNLVKKKGKKSETNF